MKTTAKVKTRKSQSPQLRAVMAMLNDLKYMCQWSWRVQGHETVQDADKQANAVLPAFLERRESLLTMRDRLRAKEGLSKLKDDGMVPAWVADALDRAANKPAKRASAKARA